MQAEKIVMRDSVKRRHVSCRQQQFTSWDSRKAIESSSPLPQSRAKEEAAVRVALHNIFKVGFVGTELGGKITIYEVGYPKEAVMLRSDIRCSTVQAKRLNLQYENETL